MKVTLENEKDNIVKLDIVIPAKDGADAYNSAVKRIAQHVNVDGFRKGKAPRPVIERQVGTERIKQEAIEFLMPNVINKAIQENNLDVIAQPYITSYDFDLGKDIQVVAKVETRPEVILGEYKGLTISVEDTPVPESALDSSVNNVLSQHSSMELVTDRETLDSDIVVIDFEGTVNGEKIKGGDAKNYQLDISNSNFIPGFAEQLIGKKLNDEFDINVTFPKEYYDADLQGKPAIFKIKINEIKEKKLPELNDEFAQKVGPFKSVEELKADIKKYLESQREKANRQNSENEVFKKVVDSAKVEIPETMTARESESLLTDYKNRIASQGISWETVIKAQGEDVLMNTIKEDAVLRIKNSLVIDKIAKAEKIKLEQKDLEKKFGELSAAYGVQTPELLKQISKNPEVLSTISQQAMNDKIRDFLMENNKIEFTAPKKADVETK